jgi:sulfopyruvate decarboxylase TPP-binding subunit
MDFKVDYRGWFNKGPEEQLRMLQEIRKVMEQTGIHYLTGSEEALPCIACVVLYSSKFHPIYGSFLRNSADRATGSIEGVPIPKGERVLKLIV